MATTPTPAAGQATAAVKADVAAAESKVKAFLVKYGPYLAGVAGLLVGHFVKL